MNDQIKEIESRFIEEQRKICMKYDAEFVQSPFDKFVGVALKSFEKFDMPINGLQHPAESEQSTNWFVWAGKYSAADDFFQLIHIHHLLQICPKVVKYLGLAPGWRFLFDNEYDDVWFDEQLLSI